MIGKTPETRDISDIMKRKVRDAAHDEALQQIAAETKTTIKSFYAFACDILEVSSEVPAETDKFFGVHVPHKLSQPVQFLWEGQTVLLRLRELKEGNSRIGVRIEESDDAKSPQERTIFKLYPHMIVDWNGDNFLSAITQHSNVKIEDVKKIIGIMVNHFNAPVSTHV